MLRSLAIVVVVTSVLLASCSGESPQTPANSTLEVLVHWDGTGIAQKRVEVLELGVEKLTDANGIARFALPAGDYTLRAYKINVGGPGALYVDQSVATQAGKITHVEVVDCLPCV